MKQRIILDDDDIHGLREGRPLLLNDSSGTTIEVVYEWAAAGGASTAKPGRRPKRKYAKRKAAKSTQHRERDEGGLFVCPKCAEEFSSKRAFGGHMSGHRRRERRDDGSNKSGQVSRVV